ncbi:MAG: hypothetical protein ACE5KJ_07045 [Candidatus Zixiibacteriota bacterium]
MNTAFEKGQEGKRAKWQEVQRQDCPIAPLPLSPLAAFTLTFSPF